MLKNLSTTYDFKSAGTPSGRLYGDAWRHSCFTDYARNLNGFGLTAIPAKNASSSGVPIKSPARRPAGFAIRR